MENRTIALLRILATISIISIGPFICGIALGFSSSVSAQLLIGDGLVALFSSIINLGALVGSLLVGPMLNNRGRRKTLLISSIPSIFGWLLIASAKGLSPPATSADPFLVFSFILGRFLSGFAAGIMNAVASVYLVEVAPPHQSGRIGSLAQFGTVAGTCFAYYCGMVFMWYETAFLVLVLSGILLAATFFLPESSAWLVKHGQMQAALKDLAWLRGDQKAAMQELSQLASSGTEPDKFTLQEHFFDKPLPKVHASNLSVKTQILRLLLPCTTIPPELSANLRIAMILMIAQQTTGINVITFYTEPLCQRMVHVSHSAECAFALGLAQLLFSLLASLFIIDRLPRRKLIVATGALMSSSMFFFAIGQQISPFLSFLGLIGFLLGFQCGWGPLGLLVATELTPPKHRGGMSASAVATSWTASFVSTQTFQPIVSVIDGDPFITNSSAKIDPKVANGSDSGEIGKLVVFLTYSILTALATIYFHHRLPETNKNFQPKPKLREELA